MATTSAGTLAISDTAVHTLYDNSAGVPSSHLYVGNDPTSANDLYVNVVPIHPAGVFARIKPGGVLNFTGVPFIGAVSAKVLTGSATVDWSVLVNQ